MRYHLQDIICTKEYAPIHADDYYFDFVMLLQRRKKRWVWCANCKRCSPVVQFRWPVNCYFIMWLPITLHNKKEKHNPCIPFVQIMCFQYASWYYKCLICNWDMCYVYRCVHFHLVPISSQQSLELWQSIMFLLNPLLYLEKISIQLYNRREKCVFFF